MNNLSGFDSPAASKSFRPKSLLRWMMILVVAAIGILLSLSVIGYLSRTTEGDVRSMIADHLSRGASVVDIYAFLDSRQIKHDFAKTGRSDSVLIDAGYSGNVRFILATMDANELFTVGDPYFVIYFILDESNRLQDYVVSENRILP